MMRVRPIRSRLAGLVTVIGVGSLLAGVLAISSLTAGGAGAAPVGYLTMAIASSPGGGVCSTPTLCSGLSGGDQLTVSGTGFGKSALVNTQECNSDPSQPVEFFLGIYLPVGCSLVHLTATDALGTLGPTSFSLVQGTVGPPRSSLSDSCTEQGVMIPNCSATGDGTNDAANFPCPPTPAQELAGATCVLHSQDVLGDAAVGQLLFGSETLSGNPSLTVSGVSPDLGPTSGGTVVTIVGTGFSTTPGYTAFAFGAGQLAQAAFLCPSSSTCITIAPPGVGTVDVTATVYSESLTSPVNAPADEFTYFPTVTGVSPNTGLVAGGTPVSISGAGFSITPGVTAFEFGPNPATGVSCLSSTTCTATTPPGIGGVDVIATVNGVSSPPSGGQFNYPTVFQVTTISLPSDSVFVPYTGSLAASYGNPPYRWSVSSGRLPPGLRLARTGRILGTPRVGGVSTFTVEALDHIRQTAIQSLSITIAQPSPTITAVHPNHGSPVGGTRVTITGTSLEGATSVTFGGTPATSFTVNRLGTRVTAYAPAEGPGVVDVTVISPGGTTPVTGADEFAYLY